jgi:hypothetical protein
MDLLSRINREDGTAIASDDPGPRLTDEGSRGPASPG